MLKTNAEEVNQLNVFPIPDGDTGDNMTMTMEGGIKALEDVDGEDIGSVADSISGGMLLGARGNSGVILSQFFAGIAKVLSGQKYADVEMVGKALTEGVNQAYASVLTPTEGTILTVARESVAYAVSKITPDSTVNSLFADMAEECEASVQRTPEALAVLKEAGVVDSGGSGLKYIIEGFLNILLGGDDDYETQPGNGGHHEQTVKAPGPDFVLTHGYCTEFLLQLTNSKTDVDAFDMEQAKAYLETAGDSIVAIRTGTLVKVHVHTMFPYRVLEHFHPFGEFVKIKIENMSLQHRDMETGKDMGLVTGKKVKKPHAVVTVANGEGIEKLFLGIGADEIIYGGQTMNPSSEDFVDAFRRIRSRIDTDVIIVFPNNGNIILAARQAADMFEDARVFVVESKSIGDGYAGISTMDPESGDPEQLVQTATEIMAEVKTGSITNAIRNTELNGFSIREGQFLGMCGKDILSVNDDIRQCALETLDRMDAKDADMINIISGEGISEEQTHEMHRLVGERFPDADVYELQGGQAVYPYIFVIQ